MGVLFSNLVAETGPLFARVLLADDAVWVIACRNPYSASVDSLAALYP